MPVARLCGLIAAGLLTWTLVEYLVHRLLFHVESRSPAVQRMVYLYHGRHHDYPSDTRRLIISPTFTIPVAALLYGLFWLLAGYPAAAPLFAGLVLGYLAYETLHFLVHNGISQELVADAAVAALPPRPPLPGRHRSLRRHHPSLGLRLRQPPPLILPAYSSYPLSRRIQMLR